MEKHERAPITEENLDQAIQQLTRLKGRYSAKKAATWMASIISLLLFLFILFNLIIASDVPMESLSGLDLVPFAKAIVMLFKEYMNKLSELSPELWYVNWIVFLLVLCIPMTIAYQLVWAVLFLVLRNKRSIIILPHKPIAKTRKLYNTAKMLSDYYYARLMPIAMVSVVIIFLILAIIFPSVVSLLEGTDGSFIASYKHDMLRPDYGGRPYSFIIAALLSVSMFLPCLVLFLINDHIKFKLSFSLMYNKDSEYRDQAKDLREDLHKYWQSIDPKEAARVAEEECKRRASCSGFTSYVADLAVYQQYKSDASRSLGYGGSYTAPSSGLTDKDHDDLDAVQRAAAARGDDFHTGV